jgi:hypothetical protein
MENIMPSLENLTIMLEVMKYYGKDYNVVKGYEVFKLIHKKSSKKEDYTSEKLRNMYLSALENLKHMGFISCSR